MSGTDQRPNHRSELISVYSDVYKEKYGIRPRWKNFDTLSTEDIEADLEALYAEPGDYDWDVEPMEQEFDDTEMENVVSPSDPDQPFEEFETLPAKLPLKGGDEHDALTRAKRFHTWRPGQRKSAKTTYNRRLRHSR